MDSKTLERYRQMFQEAQSSVDYWLDGPIVDFTEDICRLMKEKDVSKAELARRLGTSRAYVTKLLGGNANFTLATMVKVAMVLEGVVRIHVANKGTVTHWQDESPAPDPDTAAAPDPIKAKRARRSQPSLASHLG
ncbi:MAG TPA: helix-turn-helix transcriptional regulator [Thermoanaerobaculia bacterium]|nr:helix-turn-helix transcriptional regulator [Thermoanaerobaculia bacterium]